MKQAGRLGAPGLFVWRVSAVAVGGMPKLRLGMPPDLDLVLVRREAGGCGGLVYAVCWRISSVSWSMSRDWLQARMASMSNR